MSDIKISVLIPVYNAEEFLEESINSVLNQTLKDIELICVNDGSKDNSLEMLNEFARKDTRVKVINKLNGGCGSARNKALDHAKGEFVYFFDPDDYILPNAFEELYKNAKSNDSDMVIFKIARFRDGENIDYSIPGFEVDKVFGDVDFNHFTFNYKDIKSYVLNASFAPWSKLYKKEFLDRFDNFRFDLGVAFDDVPFHVKSFLRASKISFVPEFFYHYRLSNPNSVNNTKSNQIDIFKICDLVEDFLKEENYYDEFIGEFTFFKVTQILNYIISSNYEEYFQLAKKELNEIKTEFLDSSDFNNIIPQHMLDKIDMVLSSRTLEFYKLNLELNNLKEDNDKLKNEINSLSSQNKDLRNDVNNFKSIYKESYEKFPDFESIQNKLNESDRKIEDVNNSNDKCLSFLNKKLGSAKDRPLISIIMPSLNVVKYIGRCIESVINQTLEDIEIICVDAGSDDGTLELLQDYAEKDSRIKLLISDKRSYGYQMNMGISASSGEYIGIVETDDYIKEDMYETLYSLTENSTVDVAKANFWHVDASDEEDYKFLADGTKKNLPLGKFTIYDDANILNGHPSIWAGIYRRDFLINNNISFLEAPGGGWVDNPFLFETFCAAKSIKYKDEPYYYYLESNPESSTNNLVDLNLPMRRMINNLDVLKRYGCDDEKVLAALYVRIFWHIRDLFKKDNFESQKDNVCSNIQIVMQRINPDIVKKYFNEDDWKLYDECLNYSNSNLNLLFVASDNNRTSGAFLSMANLCVYLRDKYGVNVHIVVPMEGHGVEVLDAYGLNYTLIPSKDWVVPLSKIRDENYVKEVSEKREINRKAVDDLRNFIKDKNIDILHINTTYSYVGALASLKENIPFVWHLREFLEEDQSNTLWDREKGNALINKANKVVAISNSIFNKYKSVIDSDKLVCIHNGIDARRFYKPYKEILNRDEVKLIMVGGFEDYKGQIEFMEACIKVYKKGYSNFKVWFVGTGNVKIRDTVKEMVASADMQDNVRFLGYKYDVENYYKEADISFTCAKSEAFGRTTVEAMLSGNLLIGADTAGTKELIDDGNTGILYKQGNSDDLCDKIIHAIENPAESKQIADNGRRYMFDNMVSEINADNIYNLYQEILLNKR